MRSPQATNFKVKARAIHLERTFINNLYWLAFLIAVALILLPFTVSAGEWRHHEVRLDASQSLIKNLEEEIHHLAQSKSHAKTAAEKEALHQEMIAKYKALKTASEELDSVRMHVRFNHPEKGDETERKYTRHNLQSLSDFENDATLDGKLDRFLGKFQKVYGKSERAAKKHNSVGRTPASAPKPVDPDSPDQRITLKK